MTHLDFPNIAYNLSRAGHTEGIFSPSDRDGLYRYKQLVDGRYRFRDAKSGHEVCIVAPRPPAATPRQEAQTVAPTREDLLARIAVLERQVEDLHRDANFRSVLESSMRWIATRGKHSGKTNPIGFEELTTTAALYDAIIQQARDVMESIQKARRSAEEEKL